MGREREMVEVKRTLAMTRLLTLTGSGRLGQDAPRHGGGKGPRRHLPGRGVAGGARAALRAEIWWLRRWRTALGVQERPGEPLADTLVEALADKEMLLVLDNCEHLVEAGGAAG